MRGLDAYQAIQRLRPRWLRGRSGRDPFVYVNGRRRGGLDVLRALRADSVLGVEFVEPEDATIRFGAGGGVIQLRTRG